jgi:Sec-independent protein translocase protein TatA
MFNFSLAEFILVILVAIIFIKPQDLPELAKMLGKIVGDIKKIYQKLLTQFNEVAKQPEIASLTKEFQQQVSLSEKNNSTPTETVIIDMYGKEHIVSNIFAVRPDLTTEQILQQVQKNNQNNTNHDKKE